MDTLFIQQALLSIDLGIGAWGEPLGWTLNPFKKIPEIVINLLLTTARFYLVAILSTLIAMVKTSLLETPMVAEPLFIDNTNPHIMPGYQELLSKDGAFEDWGIIAKSYSITSSLAYWMLAIGIMGSIIMIGVGSSNAAWRGAGKEYLRKSIMYGILIAIILQLLNVIIEIHIVIMEGIMNHGTYSTYQIELFRLIAVNPATTDPTDNLTQLFGMFIVIIAIATILLQLIVRWGAIIFIACISPLLVMSYAFPKTKEWAKKGIEFFITIVIWQFFMSLGMRITFELVAANADGGGQVPGWAVTAGLAVMIAYVPKLFGVDKLRQAGTALIAAQKMAIQAAAAAALVAATAVTGGAAGAAAGAAKASAVAAKTAATTAKAGAKAAKVSAKMAAKGTKLANKSAKAASKAGKTKKAAKATQRGTKATQRSQKLTNLSNKLEKTGDKLTDKAKQQSQKASDKWNAEDKVKGREKRQELRKRALKGTMRETKDTFKEAVEDGAND